MLFIHPVSLAIVIYRFPPMSSITSSLPSDRGGGGSQSIQDLALDQSNKHLTNFQQVLHVFTQYKNIVPFKTMEHSLL